MSTEVRWARCRYWLPGLFGISPRTARRLSKGVRQKLHQRTRAQAAVAFALQMILPCCQPDRCAGVHSNLAQGRLRSLAQGSFGGLDAFPY